MKYYIFCFLALLSIGKVYAAPIEAHLYVEAQQGVPVRMHTKDAPEIPLNFVPAYVDIVRAPQYGTIAIDPSASFLTYTTDTLFEGQDTIVCRLRNYENKTCNLTFYVTEVGEAGAQGTEFWVCWTEGCPFCGFDDIELKLAAASLYDATVHVIDPDEPYYNHYVATFHVPAGGIKELTIPYELSNYYGTKKMANRGFLVTSTAPIALYAASSQDFSTDATCVLPTKSLGTEYVSQTWTSPESDMLAECTVVATEDNTNVHISSPVPLVGDQQGDFDVTLRRGQTYTMKVAPNSVDSSASGIHIVSDNDKKIAVFQGVQLAFIPTYGWEAGDCNYEQAIPKQSLGTDFLVPYLSDPGRDFLKITAVEDNTTIQYNGQTFSLDAYQSKSVSVANADYAPLTSDKPIEPILYTSCWRYMDAHEPSDPSMVAISPNKQLAYRSCFNSFAITNGHPAKHYIVLFAPNAKENDIILDGKPIGTDASVQPLIFRKIEVEQGAHSLECITGLIAYAYGCAHHETYSYNVAAMFRDLKDTLVVVHDTICENEYYHLGDLFLNEAGTYFDTVRNLHWADSITQLELEILHGMTYDTTEYDTICHGQSYTWHGTTYTEDGLYTDSLQSVSGCDSITHLDLVVREDQFTSTFWDDPFFVDNTNKQDHIPHDTICGSQYIWLGKTYTQSGTYSDTVPNQFGCDSIVFLHIELEKARYSYTDTLVEYDNLPFRWFGKDYSQPGTYYDTLTTPTDCDSIGELHLLYHRFYTETITICDTETAIFNTPWGPIYAGKCDSMIGCIEQTEDSFCLTDAALYVIRHSCECDPVFVDTMDQVCFGTDYIWHGQEITDLTEDSTLVDVLSTAAGCDSVVTLTLHVLPQPTTQIKNITICEGDSYTWHTYRDSVVTLSGLYEDTLWTEQGCVQETYTLMLSHKTCECDTAYSTTYKQVKEEELPLFQWNGISVPQVPQAETRDTTLVFPTIKADASCDSIATLHLHILAPCEFPTKEYPKYWRKED